MNNNSKKIMGISAGIILCLSGNVSADIYKENAFLYGKNIEVGVGPNGAFGSDINVPDLERKAAGKQLGYICDPSGEGFKNIYHGDFFLPDIPEEGWGISFNGNNYNNNSNDNQGRDELPTVEGSLSNFKTTSKTQTVTWKGVVDGLEITQVYRVYSIGTAIVIDVSLKNTTHVEMKNVYYMRTVDPDNNAEQNTDSGYERYVTTNSIISQGIKDTGSVVSAVSAGQDAKAGEFSASLLTLKGYGDNSRATYGGLKNRDPIEVYTGSNEQHQAGSNTADESISLAFKFDVLKPGATVTFRAGYKLSDATVASIDLDENDNSGAEGNNYNTSYVLGSEPVGITDDDISITGGNLIKIEEATITLSNPHEGDKLSLSDSLPAGIILDNEESSDFNIRLTGASSIEDYIKAFKLVRFAIQKDNPDTETRKIYLQVIDDNQILSDTAFTNIEVIVPVVLDDEEVTDDGIVNSSEADNLPLTGKAAPNAKVVIDFIDKNGKKLEPPKTVTADENGNWTLEDDPADISSLSDGPIKVIITATDLDGTHESKVEKEFIKDTNIILDNITPVDNVTATSTKPIFKGETDPNANVTLKLLPDGERHVTIADSEGKWAIPLNDQKMGNILNVKISAKDEAANEKEIIQKLIIPELPLIIDAPEDKSVISGLKPLVSGTSDPGTKITVTTSDGKTCRATTDNTNHWICKLPTLPSNRDYTMTVVTEDEQGNKNTKEVSFRTNKLPLSVTSPRDNSTVEDSTPVFTGLTAPDTDVIVTAEGGQTCTAKSDDEGKWSCELTTLPVGGPYDITIKAKDSVGNETFIDEKISVPKIELTIVSPTEGEKITDTSVTLTGTTDPTKAITVQGPDGQICNTISDEEGNWSCKVDNVLSGDNRKFIVFTDGDNGGKKMKLLNLNVENSSGTVRTILTGSGGGSSSLPILLILSLFSFFLRYKKK